MTIAQNRADRVMLYNIGWQQFENLLQDLGESRAAKVAVSSSKRRETDSKLLALYSLIFPGISYLAKVSDKVYAKTRHVVNVA